MNPNDKEKVDILYSFYYGQGATLWYFRTVGIVLNVMGKFNISRLMRKVVKIYEDLPVIKSFQENQARYGNLTRF